MKIICLNNLLIPFLTFLSSTISAQVNEQKKDRAGIGSAGDSTSLVTDAYMHSMLSKTKNYCVVILKYTPVREEPWANKVVWEHGRRNFELRKKGILSIICPVSVGKSVRGVSIFNATVEETKRIMDEDPAVKAKIFVYEIFPTESFPGDSLPN
jgi:hypothetical protein